MSVDEGQKRTFLAPAEAEQLTADHVVSGSPAFMAPEQVLGDRDVDALADALAGVSTNGAWTQERARQWWDQHHPAADYRASKRRDTDGLTNGVGPTSMPISCSGE